MYAQNLNRWSLLALAALLSACQGVAVYDGPARPNILLILADDMAWRDSGVYGNPEVRTPNIDRLATEGLTFDKAFTTTAMCAPSRQQLYTGLFPVRSGAYANHSEVRDGVKSIVHYLGALGYRVGIQGKRHFGPVESFPFEDAGEAFVTRDSEQPFCLVVASQHPHLPWTEGPGDYDPMRLTVPPDLVDNAETRRALAAYYSEVTAFDAEVGHWLQLIDAAGVAERTIVVVTSEHGPSFPGGKWTCYDLGLKTALVIRWPGRVRPNSRTDAMVQYVDIVATLLDAVGGASSSVDSPTSALDGRSFLSVLLGQASEHRTHVYGVQTTQGIIGGKPYPIRSIRNGRFKYVANLKYGTEFQNTLTETDKGGYWRSWLRDRSSNPRAARLVERYRRRPREELYNLDNDPLELNNLAADARYRPVLTDLRSRLRAWMREQGDEGIATELNAGGRE